ncbi:MAG TPA: hypothetical protein VJS92_01025 [Candidatus Polarisedimenticolaceae bacterium]|nr:hypothetical protein [Candidatus Polarisedimenticolaceae bacterium]
MLYLLPFLAWLATIVSAVSLVSLWRLDELKPRSLLLLIAWFGFAAYCQFFGSSMLVTAIGSCLQTLLAVGLLTYWKVSA